MRGVAITSYGGPEVLVARDDLRVPVPAAGELLVRVRAAGVNPADLAVRNGQFKMMDKRPFPKVLGSDVAGEVVVGAGPFSAGDRVFAMLDPLRGAGATASHTVVPVSSCAAMPASLSFEDAAAVPLAALTAWQGLVDEGRLQQGQRVLVRGAGGGVGSSAVQLARDLGADVTAVTSVGKLEWVRSLGAHTVIARRTEDATGEGDPVDDGSFDPRCFDVVFDAHGGAGFAAARRWLTPRGTYVTVRPTPLGFARAALTPLWRSRNRQVLVKPDGARLAWIAGRIEQGALRSTRTRSAPLSDIADVQRELALGHTRGKIVLLVP